MTRHVTILHLVVTLCLCTTSIGQEAPFSWKAVDPAERGWDVEALEKAVDFAFRHRTSHFLVVQGGRIVAERTEVPESTTPRYSNMRRGETSDGHAIEDVASVQKSVVQILVAIAQGRGLLALSDPVSKHIDEGWSRTSENREGQIELHHLLSMTSGLTTNRAYDAEPGSKWAYNTNVYSKLVGVLESVSGKDIHGVTRDWLTEPLGMENTSWMTRPWVDAQLDANNIGLATTARDLARVGLLVLSGGEWNGKRVVPDRADLDAAFDSSQEHNPSYGHLWWLNGKEFSVRSAGRRSDGKLISSAPDDLVAGFGALGRKLYVVPSLDLVVVRLGDQHGAEFDVDLWQRLMKAVPQAPSP